MPNYHKLTCVTIIQIKKQNGPTPVPLEAPSEHLDLFDFSVLGKENILHYPSGCNVITRVLHGDEAGRRVRTTVMAERLGWPLLALKMGGAYKPKNMGSVWKLEKCTKTDLS